jgi:toxin FitB
MNVVDSSGWVEFFAQGPNAAQFEGPIADSARLLVPSICLTEVFKVLHREAGLDRALVAVSMMRAATVIDLGERLALDAAGIGLTHGLALADSIILASARAHGATLWTQDADFESIEGVEYFPFQP